MTHDKNKVYLFIYFADQFRDPLGIPCFLKKSGLLPD